MRNYEKEVGMGGGLSSLYINKLLVDFDTYYSLRTTITHPGRGEACFKGTILKTDLKRSVNIHL